MAFSAYISGDFEFYRATLQTQSANLNPLRCRLHHYRHLRYHNPVAGDEQRYRCRSHLHHQFSKLCFNHIPIKTHSVADFGRRDVIPTRYWQLVRALHCRWRRRRISPRQKTTFGFVGVFVSSPASSSSSLVHLKWCWLLSLRARKSSCVQIVFCLRSFWPSMFAFPEAEEVIGDDQQYATRYYLTGLHRVQCRSGEFFPLCGRVNKCVATHYR